MSRVDRKKIQDTDKFTVRNSKNENIERVYVPHNTTIGALEFKDADLTVLGDLYVCGSIIGANVTTDVPDTFAPYDAQYIVNEADAGLPEARTLTAGNNIAFIDRGAADDVEIYAYPSGDGLTRSLQFNNNDTFSYDDDLYFNVDTNTLIITGTVDAQNVPWISDGVGTSTAFRRRINVFPWLAGGTGFLSWDINFTNGYQGPQQFSFYETAYDSEGNRYAHGAVEGTGNSVSVGSPDIGNFKPVFNVRNRPTLRGMIQMPTSSIYNLGVAIGFAPYSTSPLTSDRPSWPSIYGNTYYALLHYFNETGSPVAGGTSVDGSRGARPRRTSDKWYLISCGSSDTYQNASQINVTARKGGRYYFKIDLDEAGVSATIEGRDAFGNNVSGSASNSVSIPYSTVLGWTVEMKIFYLNPGATDPRDFGVFGVQLDY